MSRLIDDLNTLHASYVDAINAAVTENDPARAEELAAAYDTDAIAMIAEREGRTHQLPIRRPATPDTPLRRLVARVTALRAA
ncbi:hypothetical protein [Nocardioides ungokensis]|uniref:hypothetical protein n=1 Tax=Nocardioides ungokensis TaxID=1643322 RepID=UPI0015DDC782|nr:hypothetical protein [Nocardioides ungokensis]